jgi:RHS repeat-associated protein
MLFSIISLSNKLNNNANSYRVGIRSTSDYSPFGVQLDGRTSESEGYRYGFNGMEKDDEIKGAGNSYDFGARMYDARVGRWKTIDPLSKKYPSMTPYSYTANNPILYIEIDGREFDLSNLTDEEKLGYEKKLKLLKENSKIFNYYYSVLENSKTVYTIRVDPKKAGNGSFYPQGSKSLGYDPNTVEFKSLDDAGLYVISQELFHAYQHELINSGLTYKNYETNKPMTNIETEGDLVSNWVALEASASAPFNEWDKVSNEYYEMPSVTELTSEKFLNLYNQTMVLRQKHYIERANEGTLRKTSGYLVPPQFEYGPETIIKLAKELDANESRLQGPRLENGGYYEN